MKDMAIVVLNYNNFEETKKCVDNLLNIGINKEIVIVDNKSTNESFKILKNNYVKFDNIHVIETEKNGGYSYGNNFGIKYIIKKYPNINFLCIMNPDVIISYSKIIDNIIDKLKQNDDVAAMSAIMILNGYLNYEGMCWELPDKKTIYTDHIMFLKNKRRKEDIKIENNFIAKVDVIPGSFFIIKRRELEEIGYLDEKVFLYNEENILAHKLLKLNKKVALSVSDYYEHNHIKKKEQVNLKKRLNDNKIGFESRKYLCSEFYEKKCLRRLKIVNVLNIIYILLVNIIKKGR